MEDVETPGQVQADDVVAWTQMVAKEIRENAKEVMRLSQTSTELRLEPILPIPSPALLLCHLF